MSVTFECEINGKILQVLATCKSVIETHLEGLSLTFLDENDIRIHVSYDKELFEEIEAEAEYYLSQEYYNPEVRFNH